MKRTDPLAEEKAPFARIEPACPYVGRCGGCSLQDLAYADQVKLKRRRLLHLLDALDPSVTVDLAPSEPEWRYRNKAELTFSSEWLDGAPRVTLGYHRLRSFWRIVDLDDCLLMPEPMAEVLRQARTVAQRMGLVSYDSRSHQGWARRLVVRASQATGQVLAVFITAPGQREVAEQFVQGLREACPFVTTIYWGESSRVADIIWLEEITLLHGPPYLEEQIGPFRLQVHPLNFLQPNAAQAARIYATLQSWVGGAPRGIAWDLYCGIGLVGFSLANSFRAIHGIDLEASHTAMAPLNAARNGIANFTFHEGKAEDVLANKRFWLQEAKPDVVVVDPPRAGLHGRVIGALLDARPAQIAYLSCNATTLVRDLKPLMSHFPSYRLSRVQGFDMFPHTPHLEALVLLERR